jgi:hypothetical protein
LGLEIRSSSQAQTETSQIANRIAPVTLNQRGN